MWPVLVGFSSTLCTRPFEAELQTPGPYELLQTTKRHLSSHRDPHEEPINNPEGLGWSRLSAASPKPHVNDKNLQTRHVKIPTFPMVLPYPPRFPPSRLTPPSRMSRYYTIEATNRECASLAKRFSLENISNLKADFRVLRGSGPESRRINIKVHRSSDRACPVVVVEHSLLDLFNTIILYSPEPTNHLYEGLNLLPSESLYFSMCCCGPHDHMRIYHFRGGRLTSALLKRVNVRGGIESSSLYPPLGTLSLYSIIPLHLTFK